MVTSLQKEQKTIEKLIAEQRKKDAELNAQIDKLIAEELEKARANAPSSLQRQCGRRPYLIESLYYFR